jgi:hypothetical protein
MLCDRVVKAMECGLVQNGHSFKVELFPESIQGWVSTILFATSLQFKVSVVILSNYRLVLFMEQYYPFVIDRKEYTPVLQFFVAYWSHVQREKSGALMRIDVTFSEQAQLCWKRDI